MKHMKYCDQCGGKNRDEARVCTACGTKFPTDLDLTPTILNTNAQTLSAGATIQSLDNVATQIATDQPLVLNDRYLLNRVAGKGAMGVVYHANDLTLGTTVAIKALPPELRSDSSAIDQLKHEAREAMRLHHRNIVDIANYDECSLFPFIIMEYIDGGDLKSFRIQVEDPSSIEILVSYAVQTCEAVAYAHEEGIIHRDVKPSNLMVDGNGRLVVTDFGIADTVHTVMARVTSMTMPGTPLYMAPELFLGNPATPASDQYAIGITLYEFVTGKPPFADGDIGYRHRHEEPAALVGIPEPFATAIPRCLQKDPEERWESIDALRDVIQGTSTHQPTLQQLFPQTDAGPPTPTGLVATATSSAMLSVGRLRSRISSDQKVDRAKYLLLTVICGLIAALSPLMLGAIDNDDGAVGTALVLAVIVYSPGLAFMRRIWVALSANAKKVGATVSVDPDYVVVLSLIPLYNIYWIFKVFTSFADDFNETIQKPSLSIKPVGTGKYRAYAIFVLCLIYFAPAITFFPVSIPFHIFTAIIVASSANALEELALQIAAKDEDRRPDPEKRGN
jgi:serine/threonine protein kinase